MAGAHARQILLQSNVTRLGLGAGLSAAEMAAVKWSGVRPDIEGVVLMVGERHVPMVRRYGQVLMAWKCCDLDHEYVLCSHVKSRTSDDAINKSMRGETNEHFRPVVCSWVRWFFAVCFTVRKVSTETITPLHNACS